MIKSLNGKFEALADEGLMVIVHNGKNVMAKNANNVDNIEEIMKKCYELGLEDGRKEKV